jgi:UDP-N-acetylmuramyl tripeptide synthase
MARNGKKAMKLSEILGAAGIAKAVENDVEIAGIENNSGRIERGDIFVAIRGSRLNGAD